MKEDVAVKVFLKRFSDLNSRAMELQFYATSLSDDRVLFDGVVDKYIHLT